MEDLLQGAIDAHVHSSPDFLPRRMDDLDLARKAHGSGLGGLVLKNHFFPTTARAHLASKSTGLRVWGGIVLNLSVGGWNPWAVRGSIGMGGKIVWMPTVHARHMLDAPHPVASFRGILASPESALSPLAPGGQIRPDVLDLLDLIAGADAVLATGHLAPRESIPLVREASNRGIKRILLTHPFSHIVGFTQEQVMGLISEVPGLWVEFTSLDLIGGPRDPLSPAQVAHWIQEIGPERVILASDGGQPSNPPPPIMLANLLKALRDQGLSREVLRSLVVDNPKALLE